MPRAPDAVPDFAHAYGSASFSADFLTPPEYKDLDLDRSHSSREM